MNTQRSVSAISNHFHRVSSSCLPTVSMQLRFAGRLKGNEQNVDGRKGYEGREEYEEAALKIDGSIWTRVSIWAMKELL